MSDLGDEERRAAERAAEILDEEAELGELLWTDQHGGRCYHRRDGDASVLTILRPDARPLVNRLVAINWDLL